MHLAAAQLRLDISEGNSSCMKCRNCWAPRARKTKVFLCLIPGKPCKQKQDLWGKKKDVIVQLTNGKGVCG